MDLSRLPGHMDSHALIDLFVSHLPAKGAERRRRGKEKAQVLHNLSVAAVDSNGLASWIARSQLPSIRTHAAVPYLHNGGSPTFLVRDSRMDGAPNSRSASALPSYGSRRTTRRRGSPIPVCYTHLTLPTIYSV